MKMRLSTSIKHYLNIVPPIKTLRNKFKTVKTENVFLYWGTVLFRSAACIQKHHSLQSIILLQTSIAPIVVYNRSHSVFIQMIILEFTGRVSTADVTTMFGLTVKTVYLCPRRLKFQDS